jgi:methylmalonyl-CoA epimerase
VTPAAGQPGRAVRAGRPARERRSPDSRPTSRSCTRAIRRTTRPPVEICAPAGNAALERFLARRGPGLHHVCFEVEDLGGALATLKAAGVRLIDETPRPGARGHLVAFLHPAATGGVLFELCEPAHAGSAA